MTSPLSANAPTAYSVASGSRAAAVQAPDVFGQISAFFGLPGAPATSAPTIASGPMLLRLTIGDVISGQAPTPVADPSVVITGLFRQMLRQDPTAAELQNYLRVWNLTGINGAVAGLYSSTAFRQLEVNSYYLEMLNRPATQTELGWGATALTWGVPEPMFVASIASADEFYTYSGSGGGPYGTKPSATTFVDLMYRSLLGQHCADKGAPGSCSDPNAAAGYTAQLLNGTPTALVASQFVTTDTFRQVKVNEIFTVAGLTGSNPAPYVDNWFLNGGLAGIATEILTSPASVAVLRAGVELPDMATANLLQQIMLSDYETFVADLKAALGTEDKPCGTTGSRCNEALYNLIATGGLYRGMPNTSADITQIAAQVTTLLPTQDEVDVQQSLLYPLRDDTTTALYLKGGAIQAPGGIVLTANEGTYVIDGHHRWSALYVMNPYTTIAAIDLGYVPVPQAGLKETQLSVAAREGYIPFKEVQGQNLFTIGKADFYDVVFNYIWQENLETWKPDVKWPKSLVVRQTNTNPNSDGYLRPKVFNEFMNFLTGDDELAGVPQGALTPEQALQYTALIQNYLWGNVERMRVYNQPIPNATGRSSMPQPIGNSYPPYLQLLQTGAVSYTLPVISYLG